jgi:hypothetical protein
MSTGAMVHRDLVDHGFIESLLARRGRERGEQ